jgi:serine/threonine protein kinase
MSLIAEGSFGQVFKNGNHVVKKIKLIDANEDEPLVYSTIREVAFLKKFKHHNIIQLHDIKLEKDVVHISLEHGGITLTKWMKQTNNREKYLPLIAYQILEALSFLEKYNITHSDLKTSNILIDNNYHVKLIDFGGVSFRPSDPDENSVSLCSTITYQAPEQREEYAKSTNSTLKIGAFNDIFSFGLIMFTLLFAKHPSDDIDFSKKYVDILKTYKKSFSDICDVEDLNMIKFFTSCLRVDYTKRPTVSKLLNNSLFKKFRKHLITPRTRVFNDLSFMNTVFSHEDQYIVNHTNKEFKRLFQLKRWKNQNSQVYNLYSHMLMNKLLSNEKVIDLLQLSEDYSFYLAHFCIDVAIILFDDKKRSSLIDFDEVDCYFEIRQEMHCKILPLIDFDVYIDIL